MRVLKRVAFLLALFVVAFWVWDSETVRLKDRFVARRFAVVEPGKLYRSGQLNAALVRDVLEEHGIRVIVDLQEPGDETGQNAERLAAQELGIDRANFPLAGDGTGDLDVMAAAIARIDRAVRSGQPVLVHCTAGTRRTGSVLFAYLRLVERRPLDEAQRELERFTGPDARTESIRCFVEENARELERRLAAAGT